MGSDKEVIERMLWHDSCKHRDCNECDLKQDENACYAYLLSETAKYLVANGVVVKKIGTWVPNSPNGYRCSVCDEWSRFRTFYCPKCGAENERKGD